MRGFGVFVIVVGVVGSLVLRFTPLSVVHFIPLPLIVFGGYLYFRGGQHAAQVISQEPYDGEDSVLYLRAFSTDPTAPGRAFRSIFWAGLLTMSTDVECLARAVRPFGWLLVIGRPGEGLPRPGGKTVYSDDSGWKPLVQEMMLTARLVIIRPAANPGVLWELARAREIVSPDRVLIELRGLSRRQYRKAAQAMVQCGFDMPERLPFRGGFIRFSPTWAPEFLPLSGPFLRRAGANSYQKMAVFALRPIFAQHDVPWVRPKVSAGVVAYLAVVGLMALLVVGVTVAAAILG